MTRTLTILLFTLLLMPGVVSAQSSFETGLWGGVSSYNGDLNRDNLYGEIHPAAGLLFRYNFNQRLSARMTLSLSVLKGDDLDMEEDYHIFERDPDTGEPWYEFETDIHEFSLQAEFNILPFEPGNMETRISPYVFAGGGGVYFYPTPWRVSENGDLRENPGHDHWAAGEWPPGEEGDYSNLALLGLGGLGVKMNLTPRLTAGLEWGLRITNSDYLDEVSQRSPYSDETDWYSFGGITLTYRFEGLGLRRTQGHCPY